MAGRVIWHRLAEEDLSEAYLYLGTESPSAAERLLDAVEDAVRFLHQNPGAGRQMDFRSPRARSVRSWVLSSFSSYLVFYRSEGEVVRFLHGARDLPRHLEDEG